MTENKQNPDLEQAAESSVEPGSNPRPGSASEHVLVEDLAVTDGQVDETASPAGEAVRTLQAELALVNDRHLRLAAEFDNYRKRVERERTEAYGRAQADLVRKLLDILDDLERVTLHAEDANAAALLDGVRLVEMKLHQVLGNAGLEVLDAEGEVFDPNTMEAIATVPAEHPDEDEVVADVFQRGYRFRGMLVRPARVRVKQHEG